MLLYLWRTSLDVLLVEDNEVNMEIAAFLLEGSGAEVTKAWNGAEGLEKFNASAPVSYTHLYHHYCCALRH